MSHTKTSFIVACIAGAASVSIADIVRVDEFSSSSYEGFEQLSIGNYERGSVETFGGMATLFDLSPEGYLHTTGVWSYNGMTPVRAIEGARMLGSNYGIGYDFDTAQHSFGGYFASITGEAGGQIRFYQGDALLGSEAIVAPIGNEWAWNGWSSDEAFDRVEIESNYISRGYLMHDAVRVLSMVVPSPGGSALAFGGLLVIARRRR